MNPMIALLSLTQATADPVALGTVSADGPAYRWLQRSLQYALTAAEQLEDVDCPVVADELEVELRRTIETMSVAAQGWEQARPGEITVPFGPDLIVAPTSRSYVEYRCAGSAVLAALEGTPFDALACRDLLATSASARGTAGTEVLRRLGGDSVRIVRILWNCPSCPDGPGPELKLKAGDAVIPLGNALYEWGSLDVSVRARRIEVLAADQPIGLVRLPPSGEAAVAISCTGQDRSGCQSMDAFGLRPDLPLPMGAELPLPTGVETDPPFPASEDVQTARSLAAPRTPRSPSRNLIAARGRVLRALDTFHVGGEIELSWPLLTGANLALSAGGRIGLFGSDEEWSDNGRLASSALLRAQAPVSLTLDLRSAKVALVAAPGMTLPMGFAAELEAQLEIPILPELGATLGGGISEIWTAHGRETLGWSGSIGIMWRL